MTPGIQPSKVKMRLRKKLAMRPVISTASGGSTTQKKYRRAFIWKSSSSASASALERGAFSCDLRPPQSAPRNLRSQDSRADRGKDDAIAVQHLGFVHQYQSPCICRS